MQQPENNERMIIMPYELPEPITREEHYLAKAGGMETEIPEPITREEKYLAKAGGMDVETPEPITRREQYLDVIAEGGGSSPTLITKSVTQNGTYSASDDSADGYSSVSVDVANSYTASDEGKVVSGGALVAQTSATYTANDTYDTTLINSVTVNVPTGGVSVPKKDVNFYDYDGSIVASYTAAEFAELTAMPNNPTHTGLTSQGWTWSLSDAKT